MAFEPGTLKIMQLIASIFFTIAIALVAMGQTDTVRKDSNTLFGTNVAAFALAFLAAIIVIVVMFF